MSKQWNQRYCNATALPAVNPLLQQWEHLLPTCQPVRLNQTSLTQSSQQSKEPSRALDLACGLGQNTFYLANKGFEVHAWDSASVAIEHVQDYAQQQGLGVFGRQVDFVQDDLGKLSREVAGDLGMQMQSPCELFDLVIVSAYLQRSLCPQIIRWLKPNGVLFYQTFNQVKIGKKPSNPDFLLQPGELLRLFAPLLSLVYWDEQTQTNTSGNDNHCSNLGKALLIAKKTTF